ncbi:hypothetical protein [Wenzhouxiangella sp. EGI_FJ10305]|uniref:hypothetical protein n=1 Tax=Wenzhouxiangella sp. EGI_FJ10305 TaxID=3243768 RepID=UPI0035DBADB2
MRWHLNRSTLLRTIALGLGLAVAPGLLLAEQLKLTRSVFATAGTLKTWTADNQWRVSGTLGQWEATPPRAVSNNNWTVTGGFWTPTATESEPEPPPTEDFIFSDRFQTSMD